MTARNFVDPSHIRGEKTPGQVYGWPEVTVTVKPAIASILIIIAALSGCVKGPDSQPVDASPRIDFEECLHPWPCADGSEWPVGLEGPFSLRGVEPIQIPAPDGVLLDGWLAMPDVPEGVKVPVLLSVSPYFGMCNARVDTYPAVATHPEYAQASTCVPPPSDPVWWTRDLPVFVRAEWGVWPIDLVEQGYAVALFNQRGTGKSEGCFQFGVFQQHDESALVEALGAKPWSNGRVAMGGLSAASATALLAAIDAPPSLKTMVITGLVTDMYTFFNTPQGAGRAYSGVFAWTQSASVSYLPPARFVEPDLAPERICPDGIEANMMPVLAVAVDDRQADHWNAQRPLDHVKKIQSSVLIAHGFDDLIGHSTQENMFFDLLDSPRRQVVGQWAHTWPRPDVVELDPAWEQGVWLDLLVAWLDFWLKGIGDVPEALGHLDHQDSAGTWRRSDNWPPSEAKEEVLYLVGDGLQSSPGAGSRTYRTSPTGNEPGAAQYLGGLPITSWPAICDPTGASTAGTLAFMTEPLPEPVVLAGNPIAYLRLSSDLPGGIVSVDVWKISAGFSCEPGAGGSAPVELIMNGAADLRFHKGNFVGKDFPVNTPTNVRFDLWDIAESIEVGNRLAIVVSEGETLPVNGRVGQPYRPAITVWADGGAEASHIVLPFVEGTLGGEAPTLDYPPRPFIPASGD